MPPSKNQIAATLTKGEAMRAGVLDAEQVREHITINSKKAFGFTRKILPPNLPQEPYLYLYSISEYGDVVELGPGFPKYTIHACPEGEDYGEPCIIPVLYFMEEAKVDVTEHTPFTSQQIAEAILKIGPGMNSSWDRRKMGWFVSASNPPTDEEIKRAIDIYTAECKRLLNEGNRYAHSGRQQDMYELNETHRRAAKFLKQKVDWDKPMQKMIDCPGCQEPVKPGMIFHAPPQGCGYIFDKAKYEENFAQTRQK